MGPSGSGRYRLWTGCLATVCVGVLLLALSVEPDPSGLGTHTQWDLPVCGWVGRTGYPCPTCGMTTAFAYVVVVRGHFIRAFLAQPAGALLAVGCLAASVWLVYLTLTGRRYDMIFIWIHWRKLVIAGVGVFLLSWSFLCLMAWLDGGLVLGR